MTKYDSIVVGAGPAGSITAYVMAKAGLNVLIVDKQKFPRDKPCGDALLPPTIQTLKEITRSRKMFRGIREKKKIHGFLLTPPQGISICSRWTPQKGASKGYEAFVIRRYVLDHFLLSLAEDAGAEFKQMWVRKPLMKKRRVIGIRSSKGESANTRIVIAADGFRSSLLSMLGMYKKINKTAIGGRTYFEDVAGLSDLVEIYYETAPFPFASWIFPISETSANIGVASWTNTLSKHELSLPEFYKKLVFSRAPIKTRLKNARQISKFVTHPIPIDVTPKKTFFGGLLATGDSAGFVNPLTGEGIYYALKSGYLAANVAIESIEKNDVTERYLQVYESLWKKEFGSDLRYGRVYREMLLSGLAPINTFMEMASKDIEIKKLFCDIACRKTTYAELIEPRKLLWFFKKTLGFYFKQ